MNKEIYPVYGALARPPMLMGIPVTIFGTIAIGSILATLLGFVLFGGHAFLILLIPLPLLFVFRTLCRNDDQAISIIGFEIMCFFKRKNAQFFNDTLTIAPDRQENFKFLLQYFRDSKKKT